MALPGLSYQEIVALQPKALGEYFMANARYIPDAPKGRVCQYSIRFGS